MDYFEGEYDFKARMTSNVKMITSKVDLRYGLLRVWVRNQGEDDFERGWFKVWITSNVKMIPSKVDLKVWITSSLIMISVWRWLQDEDDLRKGLFWVWIWFQGIHYFEYEDEFKVRVISSVKMTSS